MTFIQLFILAHVSPVLINHLLPSTALGCSDWPKTDTAPARLAYLSHRRSTYESNDHLDKCKAVNLW